jgi:uncharacterized membrane protein
MRTSLRDLTRAAAIGAATGCRSTAGLAAVAWTSRNTAAKAASGVAAAVEVGLDKYPATPSRLEPQGLVPRLLLGAACAAAVARRSGRTGVAAGAVGSVAALASAQAGVRLRAVAARRFGADLPGALSEDAVTALLARLGADARVGA